MNLRILLKHAVDSCLVSGCEETAALHFLDEMTGLLEDVAHFRFFSVPDHTLAADDCSRPLLSERDQLLTVERAATEIYEGTDAVLFDLVRAVGIVVMMVVVMMSVMFTAFMMIVIIIVVIIVMMVVMFMLVIVVIIVMMVVMLVFSCSSSSSSSS